MQLLGAILLILFLGIHLSSLFLGTKPCYRQLRISSAIYSCFCQVLRRQHLEYPVYFLLQCDRVYWSETSHYYIDINVAMIRRIRRIHCFHTRLKRVLVNAITQNRQNAGLDRSTKYVRSCCNFALLKSKLTLIGA